MLIYMVQYNLAEGPAEWQHYGPRKCEPLHIRRAA